MTELWGGERALWDLPQVRSCRPLPTAAQDAVGVLIPFSLAVSAAVLAARGRLASCQQSRQDGEARSRPVLHPASCRRRPAAGCRTRSRQSPVSAASCAAARWPGLATGLGCRRLRCSAIIAHHYQPRAARCWEPGSQSCWVPGAGG